MESRRCTAGNRRCPIAVGLEGVEPCLPLFAATEDEHVR